MDALAKAQISVRFDLVVEGRAIVHEFALDGDEDLHSGDLVELLSDGAPMRRALVDDEIDANGYLRLRLLD